MKEGRASAVLDGDDLLGAEVDLVEVHRHRLHEGVGRVEEVAAGKEHDELSVFVTLTTMTYKKEIKHRILLRREKRGKTERG
jgi:hypothetical protein